MIDFEDDVSDSYQNWYGGYSPSTKRAKTYPYVQIKPVIRTNVPRLLDMASSVVAISLWKHVNITGTLFTVNYFCAKNSYCWDTLKNTVDELTSQLPIPHSVATQIHEYTGKAQNEIVNWATYHFRTIFLNTTNDYIVYNHVSDLVWHSDCTIDCTETAKNVSKSNSPRLSDVEKYRFLCIYCLEDEMQNMSQNLFLNNFQDYATFEQHPLIRYWNCYFSEELHLIPKDENESLDSSMFRHRFVDNWPAKEYFFDRLSPDDQVRNAIWLIDKHGVMYQKVLLTKLNESQRISVYLERSVQIITNYAKKKENSADLLVTWSDVRNLITREQFVSIFRELLHKRADGSVLTGVWINIDDDFKNHILTYNNYEFIEKILNAFEWTGDFNFVIRVLQDLNEGMKIHLMKHFFMDFCEKLFSQRENLRWLDRLSNVFFEEYWKQFKQYFVLNSRSIKGLCFEYYSFGDVKGLNEMLTFLLSHTPDRIPEYKRNLLQSMDGTYKCAELLGSKTEALNEIIVDALPVTHLAIDFRKELLSSNFAIRELKTLLANNDLNYVKKIIDSFLISDEDKENLKKLLIHEPSSLICDVFLGSDESYWQTLLLWFFEEGNSVKDLKKTILVQDIFDSLLKNCVFRYFVILESVRSDLNSNSFESLNRFLIWYFESPKEVKKYKLRRIYSYSNIYTIRSLLKKEHFKHLKIVMTWFFENDAVEVEKFKKKFKNKSELMEAF